MTSIALTLQRPLHTPLSTQSSSIYEGAGRPLDTNLLTRNEPIQCSYHPCQVLYFLRVLRRMQVVNGTNPVWINFYSSVRNHVTKNFLKLTQKEHLDAFKRSLCFLNIENTSSRSLKCSETCLLFTSISSMYTSTFFPIYTSNIRVTIL